MLENKPRLIILPEEDYLHGIKNEFYPELDEDNKNKNVKFLSKEEAEENYNVFNPKENSIYILNPYKNIYVESNTENIENLFIISKCEALREFFIRAGVYYLNIYESIKDATKSNRKFEGGGGKGPIEGNVKVNSEKMFSTTIENKIRLEPFERKKNMEEAVRYAKENGIYNDVKAFIDRNILEGQESHSITFLSEIHSALEIAASLKIISSCNFGLNLSLKKENVHEYQQTITICWNKEGYLEEKHKD